MLKCMPMLIKLSVAQDHKCVHVTQGQCVCAHV